MSERYRRISRIGELAALSAAILAGSACAPSVTMTVQISDASGSPKGQATVTSTSSSPVNLTVANGDNVATSTSANYSYGLQQFSVQGDSTCTVCQGNICTEQSADLLAPPPSGNAIAPGTSPTSSSFSTTGFGPIHCSGPFQMSIAAIAVGNASGSGLFSEGPSTAQTQQVTLTTSSPPIPHKK
jgi:hypothetical protein